MSEICKLKLYIVDDKRVLLCPNHYYELIKSGYEVVKNILDYETGIGAEGILIPLGLSESKTVYEYAVKGSYISNNITRNYYDSLAAVYYSCLYGLYDKKINRKIKTRMNNGGKIQESVTNCDVNTYNCVYNVCIYSDHSTFVTDVRFIANMSVELDNLECRIPDEEEYEEEYEYFDSIKPNFGINKDDLKLLEE